MTKAELRQMFLRQRQALSFADQSDAAVHVFKNFFDNIDVPAGAVVAGYWPIKGELDAVPIMRELVRRGHVVALPQVVGDTAPMVFRAWHENAALTPGKYGIQESTGAVVTPDVVLVPMVAFDSKGHRVGYGGGFYDGTLAALGAVAIGLAYEMQRYDGAIDAEQHDVRLSAIVTDEKIYRF